MINITVNPAIKSMIDVRQKDCKSTTFPDSHQAAAHGDPRGCGAAEGEGGEGEQQLHGGGGVTAAAGAPGYIGGAGAGWRSTDPSHRDHQMRDIEDGASTGGSDPLLPASKCTHFQPIFSHYCIFGPPLPLSPPELEHLFLIAHSQSLHCQDLP